ncbi:hypothetical protein [Sphingomonas hankookensis]
MKEGGNTLWARAQLDRIVADQFGLALPGVAVGSGDAYADWKAQQGN